MSNFRCTRLFPALTLVALMLFSPACGSATSPAFVDAVAPTVTSGPRTQATYATTSTLTTQFALADTPTPPLTPTSVPSVSSTGESPPSVLAPSWTPIAVLEPTSSLMRYTDPYLGFAVEYPTEWDVTDYLEVQEPTGQSLTGIGFRSNLYLGGEQALGHYGVTVAVGEVMGTSLTDTVEYRLSPIVREVRDKISRQCCLMVDGEPGMELTGFPWERWGSRQIVVIHNGREYRLTFYPYNTQFNTPSDVVARAAFDSFLHTFTFTPITVGPTPTITPVPTPTSLTFMAKLVCALDNAVHVGERLLLNQVLLSGWFKGGL